MPRQPQPFTLRGRLACIMPYIEAALILAGAVVLVKLLWSILQEDSMSIIRLVVCYILAAWAVVCYILAAWAVGCFISWEAQRRTGIARPMPGVALLAALWPVTLLFYFVVAPLWVRFRP